MPFPLRVSYLSAVRRNPYVHLLATGVRKADPAIKVRELRSLPWHIVLPFPAFDILHIHWAELQFSYGHPSQAQAQRLEKDFRRKLRWTQARGRHLVYTVHNLTQHEGRFPDLNDGLNRWLFAHADAIHVHDAATADAIAERYQRTRHVFVIPHGNYIGVYPDGISRAEARQRLKLSDDAFVYLFLGQIRPYKGLDLLIEAFAQDDDPQSVLLIAGHIDVSDYGASIQQLARRHPRIHLIPNFVNNDELQVFFKAADVVVLPYRRATTSGAALLAYSFAKPIIAPALGPFPDLLASEQGILYEPTIAGLTRALRQARQLDLAQAAAAAQAYAATRDWTTLGARHADMYRAILSSHHL